MTYRNLVSDLIQDVCYSFRTMRRSPGFLFIVILTVALCLIAAGTYGMTAFHVARRTHEMGIRVALGADRNRVLGLVLGWSLRLALVGIALGILGTVAAAGVTANLLYGVEPLNPLFLIGVGFFLVLVAGMATVAPALRAIRIDPTEAMRLE